MTEVTTPLVTRDLFPALVTTPDGTELVDAKVAVTADGQFHIWTREGHGVGHPVSTTYDKDGSKFPPRYAPRAPWRVATPLGVFSVVRSGGCGCGNPLRAFVPWTPYRVGAG